jgi:hypothetical protein
MAFPIAQAAIELESVRLLTYNAARRKEGRSFYQGGGHGEVLGERRCTARFGTGDRMDGWRRLHAGNRYREVLA